MSIFVKDWYSPSEIIFKPEHIDWIAENYEILAAGRYPQKTTGYIDNPFAPKRPGVSARAPFETAIIIISEFNWRISQCDTDGDLFFCLKCLQYEEDRILRITKLSRDQIDRIIARVRIYISGRRKSRPYTKFIRHYSSGYRGHYRLKSPPKKQGIDKVPRL